MRTPLIPRSGFNGGTGNRDGQLVRVLAWLEIPDHSKHLRSIVLCRFSHTEEHSPLPLSSQDGGGRTDEVMYRYVTGV